MGPRAEVGTTSRCVSAFSRQHAPEVYKIAFVPKEKRTQGMPGVRCTRGRTQCGSLPQVHWSQPAFPAQWFYGFLRALPGDRLVTGLVCHHRSREACFPET